MVDRASPCGPARPRRPHARVCAAVLAVAILCLSGCSIPLGQPTAQAAATTTPVPPATQAPLPTAVALDRTPTPDPREEGEPTATSEPTAAASQPTATSEPTAAASEPTATASEASTSLLERVRARTPGALICGANADLPGFGFYDRVRDEWSGFDVDFCRAVAAAIFGDANAVEFKGLTTQGPLERFNAVREGTVDVLFRNTTWTFSRDRSGLAFGPTTFHDGQSFMLRAPGVTSVAGLSGKTICVAKGTTTAINLQAELGARGIAYTPVELDGETELYEAYSAGRCEVVTSDSSQLASKRQTLDVPSDHVILAERISREPLGPVFIENDSQWQDIVSWVVFATIYAEELGVTQGNVMSRLQSEDPRVKRLLGVEGNLGESLGLSNDFALEVIRQVGSYGDIYDRNLGPRTPFALDRGPNKAWNLGAGGVLASPPFQ